MNQQRDERLWKQAKKRADFQRSLASYFIVNGFLWALWWFTDDDHQGLPWPVWPMLGWGIGIIFQYMNAYGASKDELAEKEYQKLKNKEQNPMQ